MTNWHCQQGNSVRKLVTNGDEILQYKMSLTNAAEQEERRMSDLSDWASSVTSAAEIQVRLHKEIEMLLSTLYKYKVIF